MKADKINFFIYYIYKIERQRYAFYSKLKKYAAPNPFPRQIIY